MLSHILLWSSNGQAERVKRGASGGQRGVVEQRHHRGQVVFGPLPEYEAVSGRAMFVYATNSSNPQYRILVDGTEIEQFGARIFAGLLRD